MQLKEVFERERQRSAPEDCRTIHLFAEGSFYRAYEWSAWLCVRYVGQLKVTHRLLKNSDESMVFVGFPVTSLEKFTPKDATVCAHEDKSVSLLLPEVFFLADEAKQPTAEDFEHWKSSVPLTESSKKRLLIEKHGDPFAASSAPTTLDEVARRILSFPIERKTPIECVLFLSEIKSNILSTKEYSRQG